MKIATVFKRTILILDPEQKTRFLEYLPQKVYHTERNIALLVAVMQVCMIGMFLSRGASILQRPRAMGYLSLYICLLFVTCIVLALYHYMVKRERYKGFFFIRRLYALMLCVWVLGLSFLEQMGGTGMVVFSYLLPTTAAMMLLSPLESTMIFGFTWVGLVVMLLCFGEPGAHFGDMTNGLFVTVLALFISFRYYRSMAIEFRDREIITGQYAAIKKNNALLEQIANVDQLTGLYNRHYLHQEIIPNFAHYQANAYFGMCLMLDIDYFKQYNDLYGHLQGDECLRRLGQVITALCKQEGVTAIRYGGEEFLLVKIGQTPFDAPALAQNLLHGIEQAAIPRKDTPQQRVTASVGLWCSSLAEVSNMEAAIQLADAALYHAKSTGRNRIVQSPIVPITAR